MSEMFKITLPDGSSREMPEGSTPADVAAAIGPGLAKAALAARIDGEVRDLNRPFEGDSNLALITSKDEKDALELVRHDFAHVARTASLRADIFDHDHRGLGRPLDHVPQPQLSLRIDA